MGELTNKARIIMEELLYEVCCSEHGSCNDNCPVYMLNNHSALNPLKKGFKENRECDCFKNGASMFNFIIEKSKEN